MIIAFDLTNKESFEGVKIWISSIYKHSDPNIAKVLVGNKVDSVDERIISKSEARQIAEEHGMEYFETSAKNNINITEVMNHIFDKVYENLYAGSVVEVEPGKTSVVLKREKTNSN